MPWLDSAGQKVPHPVYTTNTGFQFFTDIEVLKNGGVTSSEPSTPDATDYVVCRHSLHRIASHLKIHSARDTKMQSPEGRAIEIVNAFAPSTVLVVVWMSS